MFGFSGGESQETVSRKKSYMIEAQKEWPFLTNFDLSTIKSEPQLVSIVKDRASLSKPEAQARVRTWMAGKSF
jgi:hypothetical protein